MRSVGLLLVAAGALAAASVATADLNKKYDPSRVKAPPLGAIPTVQPERYELPNGAVVFLLENHELPVVRGTVYFRSTSAWESAEKVGLAAMTGQVMRSGGTASYPGDWLDDRLGQIGATISTGSRRTGCSSVSRQLCRAMPGENSCRLPYFRSPRMGQPIFASWTRIWCLRPVSSSTCNSDKPSREPRSSYRSRASCASGACGVVTWTRRCRSSCRK